MSYAYFVAWYFAPAMLFNLLAYLSGWWFGPRALLPLDLRAKLHHRRIIGDGRGYTGFAWLLLSAILCSIFQERGNETLVLAIGAQLGTISMSLIKRRLGHAHGAAFRPWEHIDFILGAVVLQAFSGGIDLYLALSGILLCGSLHWLAGGLIKAWLEPSSEPNL